MDLNRKWDISIWDNHQGFIDDLPTLILEAKDIMNHDVPENVREVIKQIADNLIIQELSYIDGRLQFRNSYLIDSSSIDRYRRAYNELSKLSDKLVAMPGYENVHIAKMLSTYTYLTFGFGYKQGTIRDVIDNNELHDISRYFDENVHNTLSKFNSDMEKNNLYGTFLLNVIASDPDAFIHWGTKGKQEALISKYQDVVRMPWGDKKVFVYKALTTEDTPEGAYPGASKMVYTLPTNRTLFFNVPVIRVNDADVLVKLLNGNEAKITMRRGSKYTPGTYVVNGSYVVDVIDSNKEGTEVYVQMANDVPLSNVMPSIQANLTEFTSRAMKQIEDRLLELKKKNTKFSLEIDYTTHKSSRNAIEIMEGNNAGIKIYANSPLSKTSIKGMGMLNGFLLSQYKPEMFNMLMNDIKQMTAGAPMMSVFKSIETMYAHMDAAVDRDVSGEARSALNSIVDVYQTIFDIENVDLTDTFADILRKMGQKAIKEQAEAANTADVVNDNKTPNCVS
jgi:hypothetical protein